MWAIIDGQCVAHRHLHMPDLMNMRSGKGFPTGLIFGFIGTLRRIHELYPSVRRIIVAWDCDRSPRRLELCPEYKANRERVNEKDKEKKEEYDASFQKQLPVLKRNLIDFGVRQASPEKRGTISSVSSAVSFPTWRR